MLEPAAHLRVSAFATLKQLRVCFVVVPHPPLSLEELKSGQKALTIIHALSVCVCLPPPQLCPCLLALCLTSHLSLHSSVTEQEPGSEASSFAIPLSTPSISPLQGLSFISHQEKCQAQPQLAQDLKGGKRGGGARLEEIRRTDLFAEKCILRGTVVSQRVSTGCHSNVYI